MAKKHVYRVGDHVRIINPRIVKRVGYNLVWTDLVEEVENDPHVHEAYKILTGMPPKKRIKPKDHPSELSFLEFGYKLPSEFVRAVARMRVEERGFGGRERKIFFKDISNHLYRPIDQRTEIYGKRVAKTGLYYPPWSHYDEYTGEHDAEPGGLEDMKTHVILSTMWGEILAEDVEPWKPKT